MKKTFFCIAFLVLGCGSPERFRGCPGSGGQATGGARTGGAVGTGGRVSTGGATATGGASSGGAPATGGRGSGGASSGGAASGGAPATGGSNTGGSASGGAGGGSTATILWRDTLQTGNSPWGIDELLVERPTEVEITGSDARGANLSRVADPAGGAGFALRHLCTFDQAGCRSEAGIWSFQNPAFNTQAKSAQGVWVAMEMYFPVVVTAGGEEFPWLSIWDWHSTDNTGGGNRWATSPGVMLAHDGSMRLRFEWGGPSYDVNGDPTPYSTLALPVGRWVDVEMHYVWSATPVRLDIWIDGQPALSVTGVTKRSSAGVIEVYSKWYGAQNDGARSWSPSPTIRYTRNIRIANGHIWPQK